MLTVWVWRPLYFARDELPDLQTMGEADLNLNLWILAWTGYAALAQPLDIFDANVFHPARNTLAGSENMLGHLFVTAPAWALSKNAAVVYKAVVLESFVLTGLAMYVLVHALTRQAWAALVAGVVLMLSPWRVDVFGVASGIGAQPQFFAIQYVPLGMLALHRWRDCGSRLALAGVAAALVMQALSCLYLGYFAFVALAVYGAALVCLGPREAVARRVLALAVAMGCAALLLVPVGIPYVHARETGAVPVHDPHALLPVSFMFPLYATRPGLYNFGPLVLAIIVPGALWRLSGWARGARRVVPAFEAAGWILLAISAVLAAGPYLWIRDTFVPFPYLLFYHLVPGFSSLRAPGRFIMIMSVAWSALVGYLLATWGQRWPRATQGTVAGLLIVASAAWCAWTPQRTRPGRLGTDAPPVYTWLARQPRHTAVLEIPLPGAPGDIVGSVSESRYMLYSTLHWHPILNGYTAYPPRSSLLVKEVARRLPARDALQTLVNLVDVSWVVVHRDRLLPGEAKAWDRAAADGGLVLATSFGPDSVYRVTLSPARDWRGFATHRDSAETLEGTRKEPLPADCRDAEFVAAEVPARMYPSPVPIRFPVTVRNRSRCPWPALDVPPAGLVALSYQWRSEAGKVLARGVLSMLSHDVPPEAEVRETMAVFSAPLGRYRLRLLLVQDGLPEPLSEREVPVEVIRWPVRTPPR